MKHENGYDAELREAVYEFHRYLSDGLAPMMVTDAVEILLRYPPSLAASEIEGWLGSQYRGQGSSHSVSDYLYHAMKKIHLLSEFELIEPEPLKRYLEELGGLILGQCPEPDRDRLQDQLGRLGQSHAALQSGAVETIYRDGGGMAGPPLPGQSPQTQQTAPPATAAAPERAPRFQLLMERLGGQQAIQLQGRPDDPQAQLKAQVVLAAAVDSGSPAEMQRNLVLLGQSGIDVRTDQVFRTLGQNMPGWVLPVVGSAQLAAEGKYASRSAEAMHKIVSSATTAEEGARRFNDLVQAAIEQFNEGSLSRAAIMLDVAKQLVFKKEVNTQTAARIQARAHESIEDDALRKFAERPESRSVLLEVLKFFPAFGVEGLLDLLDGEKKREKRRLCLLLLEAHGTETRAPCIERLEAFLAGDRTEAEGFFQRNLIFLLRRTPMPEAGPSAREFAILRACSDTRGHWIVVREALRALGEIPHAEAQRILTKRLKEFEGLALSSSGTAADSEDLEGILDSVVSALIGQDNSDAFRSVVTHAFRGEPELGNTMARLDDLAKQNMTQDPELVDTLLKTLRQELPRKLLRFVARDQNRAVHLIRAVSGTPLPDVRRTLEEVARKFAQQELGSAASEALAGVEAAGRPEDEGGLQLSGDTEVFGLPSLLQTLADSQVNGTLTLMDQKGGTTGRIGFQEGQLRNCQYGTLTGEQAVYDLFEKPVSCTFSFQSDIKGATPLVPRDGLIPVLPTILEGVRRYDEYQQAKALVPDGTVLKATSVKPRKHPEEEDVELTRTVWSQVSAGRSPELCEAEASADAYRIRRLLAHWLESGALQAA